MSETAIGTVLRLRSAKRRLARLWDVGLASGAAEESETIDDIKIEACRRLAREMTNGNTPN